MATFTNVSMASSVLFNNGDQIAVEDWLGELMFVFNGAKRPEELAPQFVKRSDVEDYDYDGAMLLGWARQPLNVYWDGAHGKWYIPV